MPMRDPAPDWSAGTVITHLQELSSPENRAGMARYGIDTSAALGIPNAILRPLAKSLGRDHLRAGALWDSGIREARLLACFTDVPADVTVLQARNWAAEFNSWEMVDHAASLFVEAGLADELIPEFAADEREFIRRTAFAMIAWGALHLKRRPDALIAAWLPMVEAHATDRRNFVKKAVNWALRQIGKRSILLHGKALQLAQKLSESPDKTARWIGNDAIRELTMEKTMLRLQNKEAKAQISSRKLN